MPSIFELIIFGLIITVLCITMILTGNHKEFCLDLFFKYGGVMTTTGEIKPATTLCKADQHKLVIIYTKRLDKIYKICITIICIILLILTIQLYKGGII